MNPHGSSGDQLANLAIGVFATTMAAFALAWVAAHFTAGLVGADRPTGNVPEGALALLNDPADPAAAWGTDLPAAAYWLALGVLVVIVALLAWGMWRLVRPTA